MYKTIDAVRASSEVHAERLRTLYSMDICTVALPPCACTGTGVPTAAPVETALSLPKRIFLFPLALFFCAVGCTGLSEVPVQEESAVSPQRGQRRLLSVNHLDMQAL